MVIAVLVILGECVFGSGGTMTCTDDCDELVGVVASDVEVDVEFDGGFMKYD